MRYANFAIVASIILWVPEFTRGNPTADVDGNVLGIFSAKCAGCHDAARGKSKGKFGYILDLARLADNPKLIVRFQPEQSKLWRLVDEEEMPPEESEQGPLNADQKKAIRSWIERGSPSTKASAQTEAHRPTFLPRSLGWLGRFHVVVVHFPIALLLVAALAEAWGMWRGHAHKSHIVRFCIPVGAVGAIVAAILGWTRAGFSIYSTDRTILLLLHRWIGTGAASFSVFAVICAEWPGRRSLRGIPYRIALFASAILVGLAGHLGGLIVHGPDFLNW